MTDDQIYAILDDVAKNVAEKFVGYHRDNPKVFTLLEEYADQLKARGINRYSIKALFERIRWHIDVETIGDQFKLNNNYHSCYVRLLIAKRPEYSAMFETRRSPGEVNV